MVDLSSFPPGTILSRMVIDIYVSTAENDGQVTILIDRPFGKVLEKLTYAPATKALDFVFDDGTVEPFGMALKDNIGAKVAQAREIYLYQMDMATKKPLAGKIVPLEIRK